MISETPVMANDEDLQRILIVEDNDELRAYLVNSLSPMYNVQACDQAQEDRFIKELDRIDSYRIDGDLLMLMRDGELLMVMQAQPSAE